MAERDDESEAYEDKPRPKPAPDEGIQPAKPRPAEPPADDWDDDRDRPRRRGSRLPDVRRHDDAVSTIIPYKNGMALAAYYVGVFSLIPCIGGCILGPLGIIFGIIGLRRVRRNPEVKGTGHAIAGIVLGGITSLANYGFIIAIVFFGLMARR